MTAEEQVRMQYLCQRIVVEKDPQVFDQLVKELDDLPEVKHGRIHPGHKTKSN